MRHFLMFILACLMYGVPCLHAQKPKQPEILVPYRVGETWGYSNAKGELLIPVQFEKAELFLRDLAKVKMKNGWGLTDKAGKIFLPCLYDIVYGASVEGRVVVCKGGDKNGHGGKWGFTPIYKSDETELLLQYDLVRECGGEGILGVKVGNKWGAIDGRGKLRLPIEYEVELLQSHTLHTENNLPISLPADVKIDNTYLKLRFDNHLARVRRQGKWGFLNESGVAVVPIQYDFVGEYSEGLIAVVGKVQNGYKMGFVNAQNDTIIPLVYDVREYFYRNTKFQDGLALVSQAGKLGYINKQNKIVVPFQYAQAFSFNEGRAWVTDDYSLLPAWKLINERGDIVYNLPADVQLLDFEFQSGVIRVQKAGKENYLTRKGTYLLQEWAYKVYPFVGKLAPVVVQKGEKLRLGFINGLGEWDIKPEYDYLPNKTNHQRTGDFIKLRKVGKFGIISVHNQVIVPFEFEGLEMPFYIFQNQLYGESKRLPAMLGGKWGYLNGQNKWAIKPQYEQVRFFADGFAEVKHEGQWGYIDKNNLRFWR